MKLKHAYLVVFIGALLTASCGEKVRETTTENGAADQESGAKNPPGEAAPPPTKATVQSLGEEHVTQIGQMSRALEGIRKSGSLERGEEILGLIAGRIRSIGTQLESLEVPPLAEQKKIGDLISAEHDKMQAVLGARENFMQELPEGVRGRVNELMDEIGKAMDDTEEIFGKYFHGEDPNPDLPQPTLGE